MGFGHDATVDHFTNGLLNQGLVVMQHQSEDVGHLSITPFALEQYALELPETPGHGGKRCAIAQLGGGEQRLGQFGGGIVLGFKRGLKLRASYLALTEGLQAPSASNDFFSLGITAEF